MSRMPRILPLAAVAICGVLGLNALAGAESAPELFSTARAYAEDAVKAAPKAAPKAPAAKAAPAPKAAAAAMPAGKAVIGAAAMAPPSQPQVCVRSPGELAREAGLSPAELQMLQSLGARRGQLDQREAALDVQLKLIAAAEAKLDAKLKSMTALKGDIQNLLGQVDTQGAAENTRLVRVYEAMKPKDAAARMTIMSDEVRLPIASKMKERNLSTVLGYMPPAAAKDLTEKLAKRYATSPRAAEVKAAADAALKPAGPAPKAPPRAAAPAPAATGSG